MTRRELSHQIMIFRFGSRSTATPAGSDTKMKAPYVAAVTRPTSMAEAPSMEIAASGRATVVTAEPVMLIVSPVHRSAKFR